MWCKLFQFLIKFQFATFRTYEKVKEEFFFAFFDFLGPIIIRIDAFFDKWLGWHFMVKVWDFDFFGITYLNQFLEMVYLGSRPLISDKTE